MPTRVYSSPGLIAPELGSPAQELREELRAPYERFIKSLTQDLLARPATEHSVEDWTMQLLTGASLRTVANCMVHSSEYREQRVREHYEKILGRTPNGEGLKFWINLLAAGRSQEEIAAAMLSSNEYFNRQGASNDRFMRALFQDVLQRRSADFELDAWIALLNSHSASRLCVAFDFLTGEEYRSHLVRGWHWKYLRREPSPESLQRMVAQMKGGNRQEQVLAGILSSREYFVRAIS